MKTKTLTNRAVTFRWIPGSVIRLTMPRKAHTTRGVRAFALGAGNVRFADTSEGPWHEIELSEALNLIIGSRAYENDNRHPVIAQINELRRGL